MLGRLEKRLRALLRRDAMEHELDEELRYHLEREVEQNMAGGMSLEEARFAALKSFGGVEQSKERCREARGIRVIEHLWQDLRFGVRMLRRNPVFTAVAVLTLALGIGANTAIFSVVNAVLLRPLPYRDPSRLVTVLHEGWKPVAPANFFDWREQNQVFETMAAAQAWDPNLTGRDQPEHLNALQMTADMFLLLGVKPMLGRTFMTGEDQPGKERVVVLSYRLWQRRFGGDVGIVGQQITLDGESYLVIGVMPPDFQFAPFWATRSEIWSPLNLNSRIDDRRGQSLRIFARLKAGVTREQAQAQMSAISQQLEQQYPASNKGLTVAVDSLHEKVVGDTRTALLILLGAVGLVLLIACANVANLMLARATSRQKEMAVRLAMGSSRGRIIRLLLTESMLLAFAGGAFGLFLGLWGVEALVALSPSSMPRVQTISLDLYVLSFTLALSALTGLLFGLAPAIQTTKLDLNETLKDGGRSSTSGGRRNGLRRLLVIAEVALTLVLLIGGGLLMRSFLRLQSVDPGFNPQHVLTMVVSLAGSQHSTGPKRLAFFNELLERANSLPGVQSASAINHLPLGGDMWSLGFTIEGRPRPAPGEGQSAVYRIIRPDYFKTMGITILKGRDFNRRDNDASPQVVIINETLARLYWPDADPIGQRITVAASQHPCEIVGLVKDVKQDGWTTDPKPEMYLPHLQTPDPRQLTVVVRTTSDPLKLAPTMLAEVWSIDKNLPVSEVASMKEVISSSIERQRFNMFLLGMFAAVALTLAAVGVYGVMSYSVTERTQEIGIRIALGAQTKDVLKLIIGQGMMLALVGIGVGLSAAYFVTHIMAGMLYGISATDYVTFGGVAVLITAVAFFASYIPARRAAKVNPTSALRSG